MNASPVLHTLEPVWNESSRVLILGTMPSPKSRETGFYYGHPQNRFWRVMADLFGEPFPPAPAQRRELVLRRGIALWDVLASCVIRGADDASIREPKPNDIGALLHAAPIRAVFTTGKKAFSLYSKLCLPQTGMQAVSLPSTSAANCCLPYDSLLEAYRAILPFLEGSRLS